MLFFVQWKEYFYLVRHVMFHHCVPEYSLFVCYYMMVMIAKVLEMVGNSNITKVTILLTARIVLILTVNLNGD